MPPQSAVVAWKAILKLVQGLPAQSTPEQEAEAAVGVLQQLETLRRAFVPRATWKQLIKELQVSLWYHACILEQQARWPYIASTDCHRMLLQPALTDMPAALV